MTKPGSPKTFDRACGSLATFASRMIRTIGVNRAYVTVFQRHVHGGKIIFSYPSFSCLEPVRSDPFPSAR
jgi:hypothetical protein